MVSPSIPVAILSLNAKARRVLLTVIVADTPGVQLADKGGLLPRITVDDKRPDAMSKAPALALRSQRHRENVRLPTAILFSSTLRVLEGHYSGNRRRNLVDQKEKGVVCMAPISGKNLDVFKDICGLHSNFTPTELARISEIARELKIILEDSNKREQEAVAKAAR